MCVCVLRVNTRGKTKKEPKKKKTITNGRRMFEKGNGKPYYYTPVGMTLQDR